METGILATDLTSVAASSSGKSDRSVFKIIDPKNAIMGSIALKNIIQGDFQNYVSPFFLFDEFGPMQLPKRAPLRVDAHPHAGIIPTTYLLEGNAHHRDSMDNDFQYRKGDFIQFTSGKGALHMEETGDELYKNGGTFHGIQSWLNMPSHLKKSEPYATHFKNEDIPVIEKEGATVNVILGEVFGVKANTELLIPVIYWHISMKENTSLELPIDKSKNAFVYLLKGQLEAGENQTLNKSQAVLFERDNDFIKIKANVDSDFLVLGGQVNNEPYSANGPFVLNNEEELRQTYVDFEVGKHGDLAKTKGIKRR